MNSGQGSTHQRQSPSANNTEAPNSRRNTPFGSLSNVIIFLFGIVCLVVGYILLSIVDAQATNVAAILSPIVILAGFGLVALSLLLKQ